MSVAVDKGYAQRISALQMANHARAVRARAKRDLKAGPSAAAALRKAARVVNRPPDGLLGMGVGQLLGVVYGWGPRKLRLLLLKANVDAMIELGALSRRQRVVLVGLLVREAERRS